MKCEFGNHVQFGSEECSECRLFDEYQIQIVLVKRRENGARYEFDEVMRTDPVYCANVDSSGHAEAIVWAIEKYARSL